MEKLLKKIIHENKAVLKYYYRKNVVESKSGNEHF